MPGHEASGRTCPGTIQFLRSFSPARAATPRAEKRMRPTVLGDMLAARPRAEADGPLVASPRLGAWSGDVATAALVARLV